MILLVKPFGYQLRSALVSFKNGCEVRYFPGSPVVKTALPMQGARVPFLLGELKSCIPYGTAKKKKKEKLKDN